MTGPTPKLAARLLAALVALVLVTAARSCPAGCRSVARPSAMPPAWRRPRDPADPGARTHSRCRSAPRPRMGRFSMDLYQPQRPRAAVQRQLVRRGLDADDDEPHGARRAEPHQVDPEGALRPGTGHQPWVETRPGASVYGWAVGLGEEGYGTFQEMSAESRAEALRMAARQMRLTRKPVGCWSGDGAHAWVMSGFKATADPAYTDDFDVTAVWIEDPWFGRVSRTLGQGPRTAHPRERPGARAGLRQVVQPPSTGIRPATAPTSSWRRSRMALPARRCHLTLPWCRPRRPDRRRQPGGSFDSRPRQDRVTRSPCRPGPRGLPSGACVSRPGT